MPNRTVHDLDVAGIDRRSKPPSYADEQKPHLFGSTVSHALSLHEMTVALGPWATCTWVDFRLSQCIIGECLSSA